jgi:hypothetical protein
LEVTSAKTGIDPAPETPSSSEAYRTVHITSSHLSQQSSDKEIDKFVELHTGFSPFPYYFIFHETKYSS